VTTRRHFPIYYLDMF
jgi:hypothetical protein